MPWSADISANSALTSISNHRKAPADAITRTASHASEMGVGDVSTLVEFTSRRPEIAPKAVFILHNRSPQAVISLKTSGIAKLVDLYGHVLGQGPADAPSRMFPALASIAGLNMSRIEIRQFSPQLRDTMLLTNQVDAVTGFDSTVLFNLKANGVAIDDATVIYYADNGLDVYGNAFLANADFLRANPEAVKSFVRAAVRGWREAIAHPAAAMESLGKHNNLAKLSIEGERTGVFASAYPNCPKGKLAFASVPSASSAGRTGHLQGWPRAKSSVFVPNGTGETRGMLF